MKADYIIGIDPDTEHNGYAMIDMDTRKVTVATPTLPVLLDMVDVVQSMALATDRYLTVFVEAGWMNLPNWHLNFRDSKQMAAAKGRALGRNHQRGMDIIELLMYRGVDTKAVAPLRKIWKGKDRKITQRELEAIVGKVGRTNQEGRDAAILAWVNAGLPLRRCT